MKSQFFKVTAYSSKSKKGKRCAQQIANEAMRIAGFCNHVLSPEKPKILYGHSPVDVVNVFKNNKDSYKDKAGRVLRKDALFLLAGIISFPDRKVDESLIEDCIKFLEKHYGSALKSVLSHSDENDHFHLHFYCVPESDKEQVFSIETVHPGILAKNRCSGSQNQKDVVYKRAMQKQNEKFYNEVSLKHGYSLKSVSRERIQDRNEYFQHQRQISALTTESKRLKQKSKQLIEKHVDNRIENVHLVNQQHYLKQNEQKLHEQTLLLVKREEKLQVKEQENAQLKITRVKQVTKLRSLFTDYINKITTNPISVKDKIIIKLKKEKVKFMKLINEQITSIENLKSALLKTKRENQSIQKKLDLSENKNSELSVDIIECKKALKAFKDSRLCVLKLIKSDKIDEAVQSLTFNRYLEESDEFQGYKATQCKYL
jgi:hypothetical protein